jgi:hypothetical protein
MWGNASLQWDIALLFHHSPHCSLSAMQTSAQ